MPSANSGSNAPSASCSRSIGRSANVIATSAYGARTVLEVLPGAAAARVCRMSAVVGWLRVDLGSSTRRSAATRSERPERGSPIARTWPRGRRSSWCHPRKSTARSWVMRNVRTFRLGDGDPSSRSTVLAVAETCNHVCLRRRSFAPLGGDFVTGQGQRPRTGFAPSRA